MSEPTFDQRSQQIGVQVNVAGDLQLHPPAPAPEPGRLIGRVPARSACFTGREEILDRIHRALRNADAVVAPPPQALKGMPGIGKTTTAVEYVYQAWRSYSTVAWVLADTPLNLQASFAALAPSLGLRMPANAPQTDILNAVLHWFQSHTGWLIVADNVEDMRLVRSFLPTSATGHILFTTRRDDVGGGAVPIRLDRMDEKTGALLLLRRARHIGPQEGLDEAEHDWCEGALAINRTFDGLPLALEQAGAYIASRNVPPSEYLALYEKRKKELLSKGGDSDHDTVMVTFDLALQQVEAIETYGSAAAQLIRLSAFLAPDLVPDELFRLGAEGTRPPLRKLASEAFTWSEVLEAATRYSLIQRDANLTGFTLHRLVAEVIHIQVGEASCLEWAHEAIRVIDRAFPNDAPFELKHLCGRLLPHALMYAETIKRETLPHMDLLPLAAKASAYLRRLARYSESESLSRAVLTHRRRIHGNGHAETAVGLSDLALTLEGAGKPLEAAGLLEEAVRIDSKLKNPDPSEVATHLQNLSQVLYRTQNYEGAESAARKALPLTEDVCGRTHIRVARILNTLGQARSAQGDFVESEELRLRDIRIKRELHLEQHPEFATSISNLGMMYVQWWKQCGDPKRANNASDKLREAIERFDAIHEGDHQDCAYPRLWLGHLYARRGEIIMAGMYLREAVDLFRKHLGQEHPTTLEVHRDLSKLLNHKSGRG